MFSSVEKQEEMFPNVYEVVKTFVDLHPDKATAYQWLEDNPQNKSPFRTSI